MEPSGLRDPPESVETSLKYLVSAEEVPVYVASVGGGDTSLHQGNYVRQRVLIRNGRIRPEGSTLDREGFLLAEHASAARDFYDDDEIAAVYEVEVEALVRRATGAVRVEIFDHTRRAASGEVQKERLIRERRRSSTTTIPRARGRSGCATTSTGTRRTCCFADASRSSMSGAPPGARCAPRRSRSATLPVWCPGTWFR